MRRKARKAGSLRLRRASDSQPAMRTLHAKVGGSLHREVSRCGSRYARSLQCARILAQPALRDFPKFASFNFCIDTGSAILRSMEDTPNIAKRRLREERTLSQMIA